MKPILQKLRICPSRCHWSKARNALAKQCLAAFVVATLFIRSSLASELYVHPTLIQSDLTTLVTATLSGGTFYPGTTPPPFRVRLVGSDGTLLSVLVPESIGPHRVTFNFPPMPSGYYGFRITAQINGTWELVYESSHRFFSVVDDTIFDPVFQTFEVFQTSNPDVQQNAAEHLTSVILKTNGVIRGKFTVSQHVNDGESVCDFSWTKDFPKSGENGVKFKLDFISQNYAMFDFEIPFEIKYPFPRKVCPGQTIKFQANIRYPGGDKLNVDHNGSYSTDHSIWLNAPYDGLSALEIFLSQQPDGLRVIGKLPAAPDVDLWLGGPFGDGDVAYGGVHNRLGGLMSFDTLTGGAESRYSNDRRVWTSETRVSDLWYSGGDQIAFLSYAPIPVVQEVAMGLYLAGVELEQSFYMDLLCTDQVVTFPPYLFDFEVLIPMNASGTNYPISKELKFPIFGCLESLLTYQMRAGFFFDMPFIHSVEIDSWPLANIYATNWWGNLDPFYVTFRLETAVEVLKSDFFQQTFAPSFFPGDVSLRNYTIADADAERLRVAAFTNVPPPLPPVISSRGQGILVINPGAEFPVMLSSAPPLGGTITLDPTPMDGGYSNGTVVTLTAGAAPGYRFTGWSGDASGSVPSTTITMNDVKNVTANFASPGYNPFTSASSAGSWITWPTWGLQFPINWDASVDRNGLPGSGSLRFAVPFSGAADDQLMTFGTFANRWPWDDSIVLDGTQFANLSFDIKVASGTAATIHGNYGDFEVGLLREGPTEWGRIPLPGFTLPVTNDWVHVVSRINPSAPGLDAVVGVYIKLWSGGNFTNIFTFNVDNLQLEPVPAVSGYGTAVSSYNPLAYYRLDETTGNTVFDFGGGYDGTRQEGAFIGVSGPRNPPFAGFHPRNTALLTTANASNSWVSAPFGSLNTNAATFTAWIYPMGSQPPWAGILMTRGEGMEGGLGCNGQQMLAYTWNNNTTWSYVSGLVIPTNQWSFVAMVIEPTRATLHLCNASGHFSSTNTIPHTPDTFGDNWRIGNDAAEASRTFNGVIDEVAVFTHALPPAQIQQLYTAGISGPPARLGIQRVGSELQLVWTSGTLQQAGTLRGPFSDVSGAASPHAVKPTEDHKFYRLKGPNLVQNPGFEAGTSGWYPLGATLKSATDVTHGGLSSAFVTNRTDTWSGVAQSLLGVLEPGTFYRVTAWVRLASGTAQPVLLTMKKTDDSGTIYQNVATGTATSGGWTQLVGSYTLVTSGSLKELLLYMEGPPAGVSFYADDFAIEP